MISSKSRLVSSASGVINQGIKIAVGLQHNFSWAQVAGSAIAAPIATSLTDTLLGQELQGPVQPGMPALGRASTGLTDALGRSTANIIANTLTGTVSQVIQTRFAGGQLNYANIASDAFGNALANHIGYDLGNSIVASQQAGQLAAAEHPQRHP